MEQVIDLLLKYISITWDGIGYFSKSIVETGKQRHVKYTVLEQVRVKTNYTNTMITWKYSHTLTL